MHAFSFKLMNHLISVCYLEEHWIIMIKMVASKVAPLKIGFFKIIGLYWEKMQRELVTDLWSRIRGNVPKAKDQCKTV